MSTDAEKQAFLAETGALLEGHFILTSGRHSARYFQAMRLLERPDRADRVAQELAASIQAGRIDVVLAPAVGGITWGYAMARHFPDVRAIFSERVDGKMTLRRSFEIHPGERVLLAEDVITTGGTVLELKELVEQAGATVVAFAAVTDRSGGAFQPGPPVYSWLQLNIETWAPEDCPLCREGSVAIKPGSRGLSR